MPPDEAWDEFAGAYRARLERFGVEKIRRLRAALPRAGGADGVVLLCFEDVAAGDQCHRRAFAQWWEAQTGEEVVEE